MAPPGSGTASKTPAKAPKPQKAPKPAKAPKLAKTGQKSGSSAFPVALVAGLVVAAVLGFVLSSGGGGGGAATAFSNSNLAIKAPGGFTAIASPPAAEGLNLVDPVAVGAGGKAAGPGVLAGVVPAEADNSTLLPAGFVKALNLPPDELVGKRTAVKLGGELQAYKYPDLTAKGLPGKTTVFAVPTSGGVATIACFGAPIDCDGVATTLTVKDLKPLPVGPNEAYAKVVADSLGGLSKAIAAGKGDLGDAKTSAGAASKIRAAYAAAEKKLADAPAGPADRAANASLVAALQAAEKAYGSLSTAAKKKDRGAYSKAAKAVGKAEGDVSASLAQLKAAGYAVE